MVETLDGVDVGAVDHGWADRAESERGLVLFDEIPCGFLGECLGGAVGYCSIRVLVCCFLPRYRIPVFFGVLPQALAVSVVYSEWEGERGEKKPGLRTVYPGRSPLSISMIDAKDDVMTTLLTVGAFLWIDSRTSNVPLRAGLSKSRSLFSTSITKGDAV